MSAKQRKLQGQKICKGQDTPYFKATHYKLGINFWKHKDNRPTKLEQRVMSIIADAKLSIRYVGDGKFWKGHCNPDFKVNNQNKVIEVFDPTWPPRKPNWKLNRKKHFKKYDYECLMLPVLQKTKNHKILKALEKFVE